MVWLVEGTGLEPKDLCGSTSINSLSLVKCFSLADLSFFIFKVTREDGRIYCPLRVEMLQEGDSLVQVQRTCALCEAVSRALSSTWGDMETPQPRNLHVC